jgi:hypothetical protein
MKKYILLVAVIFSTTTLTAQEFVKIDKSPLDMVYFPANASQRQFAKTEEAKLAATPKIRVLYSRPALNGRQIFRSTDDRKAGITKYGESWRLGANESTEILLFQDATIGGKLIEAGRYSIMVVPTEKEWTFHIYNEIDAWGSYSHKPEMDLVKVAVPVNMLDENVENLSIALYSPNKNNTVHLKAAWGTYQVELPIELQ